MKRVWLSMLVVVAITLTIGCPDGLFSETVEVTVYFKNESPSIAITSFQWKLADDTSSEDLIPTGDVLGAGEYFIARIDIPRNGEKYYRVKGSGSDDFITQYDGESLYVLHWACNTRYCGVTLAADDDNGVYASGFTWGWCSVADGEYPANKLASWQQE